jgi:ABC-2 type transport system ATP-binding protein
MGIPLPSAEMLLRTEHLTKEYNGFRALSDLNLDVTPGEIVGLLGPNGSGKSTALRLIMGFLRPTSGTAKINGHDCWFDSVATRQHIAYLPGELRLYENMTGRQLVTFLCALRGVPFTAKLDDMAHRLDIDLDRPIVTLSSGMKRKVALLQVLTPHAPLLILDEPTNTLDPTMREELLDQLKQARDEGQAVLFSSHILSEVEQICDRVAILQQGKLVHLQRMNELRSSCVVHAKFSKKLGELPEKKGMRVREHHGDRLALEYTGPLPWLLEWLSHQPLEDMRIEPMGLSAIYQRYHGVEAS